MDSPWRLVSHSCYSPTPNTWCCHSKQRANTILPESIWLCSSTFCHCLSNSQSMLWRLQGTDLISRGPSQVQVCIIPLWGSGSFLSQDGWLLHEHLCCDSKTHQNWEKGLMLEECPDTFSTTILLLPPWDTTSVHTGHTGVHTCMNVQGEKQLLGCACWFSIHFLSTEKMQAELAGVLVQKGH